jgi:hypothetical protein
MDLETDHYYLTLKLNQTQISMKDKKILLSMILTICFALLQSGCSQKEQK